MFDLATACCSVPRRRAPARRVAFTLIEVVLVLGILILLLGLTVPMLDRPLAYERLRRAGDQIMAEWTTARIDAMRTGTEQTFQVIGDRKYRLSADPRPEEPELPEGIIFSGFLKEEDSREAFSPEGEGGEQTIWFYPDGTCSDVPELLLCNEYGAQIRLVLRGLTGVTRLDQNVPDTNPPSGTSRGATQ
jgi:type II secretory pathway pseudopilin PulG